MASDSYTTLNASTVAGGDTMDESAITYGTAPLIRKAPRVILRGEGANEIVVALNTTPSVSSTDYGIAVRHLGIVASRSYDGANNPLDALLGSAIPGSASLLAASDGTNLRQLLVESSTSLNLRTGLWDGSNKAAISAGGALKVDGSAVTQPISGSVSIAGSVTVTGGLTDAELRATPVPVSLTSTTITGSVAVTGPLTDTQLRATPVPVDGSGVTQPISGTVNQGSAAALAGAWPIKITDGTTLALVTGTGALTVDGSGVTQPISVASLPLPTGASTAANQTTANSSLSSIDGKLPAALGQHPMATSLAVVIASDQTAFPVTLTSTTITGTVAVTGPLTDTELRATPVPVSGTVTVNAGTNLNTSALALSATQTDRTQKTQITDGTRDGTVKAANTAPDRTADTALVVADAWQANAQGSTTSGQRGPLVQAAVTTSAPSYTTAQTSPLSLTTAGDLRVVDSRLPTALGQTTSANSLPVVFPSDVSLPTSGGASISRTLSVANTTGVSIKASAGQVYAIIATNTNASPRYLKLYNTSSAPTVGTTTPVMTIVIPGNIAAAGIVIPSTFGIVFGTGIGQGITTGVADNDTGAPAANEVVVHVLYK